MNKIYLSLLALLASCAMSPSALPPTVELGGEVFTVNTQAELDEWWRDLNDDNLNALIAQVLDRNLDLAAAAHQLKAVSDTTSAIIGQQLPSLDLGANFGKSRTTLIGLPIPGAGNVVAVESNRAALDLNLSWELDFFGRLDAEEAAALAQLDASTADYAAARLAISGQVARTSIAYNFTTAQVAILENNIKLQSDLLAIAEDNSTLISNSQAVLAMRSEVLNAESQLAQSEMQLQQLRSALQTLVSSDDFDVVANAQPHTINNLGALNIDAQLIARRPDLIGLEAQLRAAAAKVDVAHASLYPSFSIGASIGGSSDELGNLLDGDYRTWNFGSNVLAPLFHGGALRKQQDAAANQYQASSLSFGQHCLRAYAEVATLLNNESLLGLQISNSAKQVSLARRSLDINKESLSLGQGHATDVVRAQLAVNLAKIQNLNISMLTMQNRVDLHLAIGGGFTRQQ